MNKFIYGSFVCITALLLLPCFSSCITIKTDGADSQPSSGTGFSVTTASLSEATTTTAVDDVTKRPKDSTDMFSVQTQEIHCSVKLSNAPPDTKITGDWIYIEGAEPGLKNYTIYSNTITADGTRYLDFSLIRPYNGWPVGDYQIIMYIDGTQKAAVPFYVR